MRLRGRDPFADEQYFADKGIAAELRKMGRQNRRAANRAYRPLPKDEKYYVPEPSTVQNILTGLETDRFERDRMVNKGFRNESARLAARKALQAALGYGIGQYYQTPKTVQGPLGPGGQPVELELTAAQRLAHMLGLGPY